MIRKKQNFRSDGMISEMSQKEKNRVSYGEYQRETVGSSADPIISRRIMP